MIRNVLAILLGVIAGSAFNMALVTLSQALYPLPEGMDPNDMDAFRAHIEANPLPLGALIIVLAAHAGGSFVSGLVCGLVARRSWYAAAAFLGILWTAGGITMLLLLPAPIWFAIADVILYVPAALLGVKLGGDVLSPKHAIRRSPIGGQPEGWTTATCEILPGETTSLS